MKKYSKLAAISLLTASITACSSSNDAADPLLNNGNNLNSQENAGSDTNPGALNDDEQSIPNSVDDAEQIAADKAAADKAAADKAAADKAAADKAAADKAAADKAAADKAAADKAAADKAAADKAAADKAAADKAAADKAAADQAAADKAAAEQAAADKAAAEKEAEEAEAPKMTPSGRSTLGNPPTLANPIANAIPSPNSDDPFGFDLETASANDVAIEGGAPTTPRNLRIDLISNDWAEINWAPSKDDVAVVEYRVYRTNADAEDDTGDHVYIIRGDDTDPNGGRQAEIDKFWRTTSFIDCNYTRFSDSLHNCATNGPKPGDDFNYEVTAVDADGQESARSNMINVVYHKASNAPVPRADDFYKSPDDSFVQDHDLSDTSYFMDKFIKIFEDNFDGPTINSNYWNTGLTWGDNNIINGEQQYFVNTQTESVIKYDPFKFVDGDLVIEAIKTPEDVVDLLPAVCKEADPTGLERCQFLSGALSSHEKLGLTYGYVESRMKVGGVSGMLSSFYLYNRYPGSGKNLHGPEIDIVEYLGENPYGDEDAFQTYHFKDVNDGSMRSAPTMSYKKPVEGEVYADDYHTFGVLWEPQLVVWYIDGKEVKRLSGPQVARQRLNIVTYLVAGSAWAPTPADDDSIYPLQYKIDYIRAYQRPEYLNNSKRPDED